MTEQSSSQQRYIKNLEDWEYGHQMMLLDGLEDDWKVFMRLLSIPEPAICTCVVDCYNDCDEQKYQLLQKKLQMSYETTWNEISQALSFLKKDHLISQLEENLPLVATLNQLGEDRTEPSYKVVMLIIISKHIVCNWQPICRNLGLPEYEIERIDKDFIGSIEKSYQSLLKVDERQRNGWKWEDVMRAIQDGGSIDINLRIISEFQNCPYKSVRDAIVNGTITMPTEIEANNSLLNSKTGSLKTNGNYEMDRNPCGKCLIFNQKKEIKLVIGKETKTLKARNGTEIDGEHLTKLFTRLKFTVKEYKDKTKNEIDDILRKESSDVNNKNFNCLVIFVLSHGKERGIITADGEFYDMKDVIDLFNTKACSMKDKPKLLFVQACQVKKGGGQIAPINPKGFLSSGPDQMVYFSATPGNKSFRSPRSGSWFIKTLCEVFEEMAHEKSLHEMVLEVNFRIAQLREERQNQMGGMCSIGLYTLRKNIFFTSNKVFKEFTTDEKPFITEATS